VQSRRKLLLQIVVCSFLPQWILQVIASEGELKASRALKEAADVIQESPSALQVGPHKGTTLTKAAWKIKTSQKGTVKIHENS
jgi:hypothetical protein